MKLTRPTVSALLAGGFLIASNLCSAHQSSGVTVEPLMKTSNSWDGSSYNSYPQGKPELSILKITIPPHTTLDWHTHPMPNAAYVLSGQLTVEKKIDRTKKTIHAGETLAETVGIGHRGFTEDEPVSLIVFYAGKEGMPLNEPVITK